MMFLRVGLSCLATTEGEGLAGFKESIAFHKLLKIYPFLFPWYLILLSFSFILLPHITEEEALSIPVVSVGFSEI